MTAAPGRQRESSSRPRTTGIAAEQPLGARLLEFERAQLDAEPLAGIIKNLKCTRRLGLAAVGQPHQEGQASSPLGSMSIPGRPGNSAVPGVAVSAASA